MSGFGLLSLNSLETRPVSNSKLESTHKEVRYKSLDSNPVATWTWSSCKPKPDLL